MAKRQDVPYRAWLKKYLKGPSWPQQMHVVGVLWTDATHADDMKDSGTTRAFTIGVVMEATEEHLKTAAEVFEDNSERDITTVPALLIESIRPFGSCDNPAPVRKRS